MTATASTPSPFPSLRLSEIVLKTARLRALRDWYRAVLDLEPFFERTDAPEPSWTGAHGIVFFRLHMDYPYSQVLALFEIPGATGDACQTGGEPGLHHMQLRHADLPHLFRRYELLCEAGIRPVRSFNHGPGTSFYYRDPDGNTVELSSANFPDERDYLAWFRSDTYRRNISGVEIDAARHVARFRAGTPLSELIRIDDTAFSAPPGAPA